MLLVAPRRAQRRISSYILEYQSALSACTANLHEARIVIMMLLMKDRLFRSSQYHWVTLSESHCHSITVPQYHHAHGCPAGHATNGESTRLASVVTIEKHALTFDVARQQLDNPPRSSTLLSLSMCFLRAARRKTQPSRTPQLELNSFYSYGSSRRPRQVELLKAPLF